MGGRGQCWRPSLYRLPGTAPEPTTHDFVDDDDIQMNRPTSERLIDRQKSFASVPTEYWLGSADRRRRPLRF
jgi:hypothetical protein